MLLRSLNRHLLLPLLTGLYGLTLFASTSFARQTTSESHILPSYIESSDLDSSIPTPASVLGYTVGDRAVRYEPLIRYLKILADASNLVTMTEYARTHEGRALYYLTITSEGNHARLDQIKIQNAKLADPRTLTDAREGEQIIQTLPGIAWLAYSIHGDEMSGVDSAVQIAYLLVAARDPKTRSMLDELVIHIDPIENPDGRERHLSQLETLQGKIPNPDVQAMQHAGLWAAGRGNHYLFDMNRDWLIQSQPETRGRTSVINDWNPHFLIDAHEMGSLDTFLMDPPREPVNLNQAESILRWRHKFGLDQGAAFNEQGWSYYSGDWYEEWYPGYTNAYASLRGTIGLLYEQASISGTMVRKPSGEIETYRDAVAHNVIGSLANLETLRMNREAIQRDFLAEKQWAISDADGGQRAFILPPDVDARRWKKLLLLLDRHEIEYTIADAPFDATGIIDTYGDRNDEMTFPEGSAVVRAAQPFRRYLNAILEFDPRMTDTFLNDEREEIETGQGGRVYDVTAWSVPMAFGLDAFWAERIESDINGSNAVTLGDDSALPDDPAYGYLIDGRDSIVYWALARLLEADCRPRIATKPFTTGGNDYLPGTVLLRKHENPDVLEEVLQRCIEVYKISVVGTETALSNEGPDLGGPTFTLLAMPRIAIASQWPMSTTSFGFNWFQMDDALGLRCSPINVQAIRFMDLRKYNVLILPSGRALGAVLNQESMIHLRRWVEAGGTLIAIGNSASTLAREDGLSSVRRKRDVLDELEEYAEALEREKQALNVQVDPALVWGDPVEDEVAETDSESDAEADEKNGKKNDDTTPKGDALERLDQWQRRFSPRGILAHAEVNNKHWLAFGLSKRLPVFYSGSTAFMSKSPVQTPVRLTDAQRVRMSGLLWPEGRQRIADTAYATVERIGNGQVILFANDPFMRAYAEGTGRLMLNAVLLGPGMGTNQPVPW